MIRIVGLSPDEEALVYQFIREKHAAGFSDAEMAEQLGARRETVGTWRRSIGLPSIRTTDAGQQRLSVRVSEKTAQQIKAAGLASLAEVRLLKWRAFARDCGWPEELRPRSVQILNALWECGLMTRRQIAEAIGMPWKGARKSLVSNDPEGSYLANLIARGLVIPFNKKLNVGQVGRTGTGQGQNVSLYMLSPAVVRGPFTQEAVENGRTLIAPRRQRSRHAVVDGGPAGDHQQSCDPRGRRNDHQGAGLKG